MRIRHAPLLEALTILVLLSACAGDDASTGFDGGIDVVVALECPGDVPSAGTACPTAGSCEYGGASGFCTTLAQCQSGAWTVTAPAGGCGQNDPSCPATFDALAQGSACPLAAAGTCVYAEGACACTPCRVDGGSSTEWTCRGFTSAGPECPTTRPPLGSACTVENAFCAWSCCEAISFGPDEQCSNGHWVAGACTAFCAATPACP